MEHYRIGTHERFTRLWCSPFLRLGVRGSRSSMSGIGVKGVSDGGYGCHHQDLQDRSNALSSPVSFCPTFTPDRRRGG